MSEELKIIARREFNRAMRMGLKKPTACERCKKHFPKSKIHGHHINYRRPLDVDWLCYKCHRKVHANLNFLKRLAAFWDYCRKHKITDSEAPAIHRRTGRPMKITIAQYWKRHIWNKR